MHKENPNYLYLIGSDKLSRALHEVSEAVNKKYTNLEFDYTYNDENDPNRFYYRSDHYNFAKRNVPVIFYFNGLHADFLQSLQTVGNKSRSYNCHILCASFGKAFNGLVGVGVEPFVARQTRLKGSGESAWL